MLNIIENIDSLYIANLLKDNEIIYIFNKRSESGPRSLGNRSMIFNPTIKKNKKIINLIKGRESFRPLACSILLEEAPKWFCMEDITESPHMTFSFEVKKEKEKFIPAIVHIDKTCRLQTVSKFENKNYYEIIKNFFNITKIPLIGNTSFNLDGEPIVETIDDAIKTLTLSKVKFLYFPEFNILVKK